MSTRPLIGAITLALTAAALVVPAATNAAGASKRDVCHLDGTGTVHVLNVSSSAIPAHLAHGDHLPYAVYADADGDGYGAGAASTVCTTPSGAVTDDTDCDDGDASVHPGAEDTCDGVDGDCDGSIDEDTLDGVSLVSYDGGGVYALDVDAGTSTLRVKVTTPTSFNSIASNLDTGETVGHSGGKLYHLDVCTGDVTLIGSTGVGNTCGTSFGPDGALYGIDSPSDSLVVFDTSTGAAKTIGKLGFSLDNCGMAYDCSTDTLLGLQVNPSTGVGEIFTIDASTGAGTKVLTLDASVSWGAAGLEIDPTTGDYLVATGSGVYRIDPSTGDATLGSPLGTNNLTYALDCE